MPSPLIRIGTRASRLALWQANSVALQLKGLGVSVEIVEIHTQGDANQSGPVVELGLQGLFTKEIQAAVLAERVDIAVHSLKDLPTGCTTGLALAAVGERESCADALVTSAADSLGALPPGSRIGTGSLRRQAQLKHLRPDLVVTDIRGNVDTRLRKLAEGQVDALVLAAAGLQRLEMGELITEILGPPRILPAPGQGALGIECRANDRSTFEMLARLEHTETRSATDAERAMLARLHAGCSAPVGAWGRIEQGELVLDGLVASLDGQQVLKASASGPPETASALGDQVAAELLAQGAEAIIQTARNLQS